MLFVKEYTLYFIQYLGHSGKNEFSAFYMITKGNEVNRIPYK